MDLKILVLVMMLVVCSTSKPASLDGKTVQLLKSVLEKLSKRRDGNKPPPPGRKPPPPPSSDEPVSFEDVKLFSGMYRDLANKLITILTEGADEIEEASKLTDQEFANALHNFVKNTMEVELKDIRMIVMELMDLISRSEAFGFLSEKPCQSQEECRQREEDWRKMAERVGQEVAQDMQIRTSGCSADEEPATDPNQNTIEKKKGEKGKVTGKDKGSHDGDENGRDQAFGDLLGHLKLAAQHKDMDNDMVAKPIVDAMRCFVGNLREFADWIEATWHSDQTSEDVDKQKAAIVRLTTYGFFIRQHFIEGLGHVVFWEMAKDLRVVTGTDVADAFEVISNSIPLIFSHFGDATAALSIPSPDVNDLLKEVAHHIIGLEFDIWSLKMDVERYLRNMAILGFEGNSPCEQSFTPETSDEFIECLRETLGQAIDSAEEEREKIRDLLESSAAECNSIRGHLDTTYKTLHDLAGGMGGESDSVEKLDESEIMKLLRDIVEFDGTIQLVRDDMECMGDETILLMTNIDFSREDLVATFFEITVVLDYLRDMTKVALDHLYEITMIENIRQQLKNIVKLDEKAVEDAVQKMTKNLQMSMDKLKSAKLASFGTKGFLGLNFDEKSGVGNDNDSSDTDDDDDDDGDDGDDGDDDVYSGIDDVTEIPSSGDDKDADINLTKLSDMENLKKIKELLKELSNDE